MSAPTLELESLLVRIIADASQFNRTMDNVKARIKTFSKLASEMVPTVNIAPFVAVKDSIDAITVSTAKATEGMVALAAQSKVAMDSILATNAAISSSASVGLGTTAAAATSAGAATVKAVQNTTRQVDEMLKKSGLGLKAGGRLYDLSTGYFVKESAFPSVANDPAVKAAQEQDKANRQRTQAEVDSQKRATAASAVARTEAKKAREAAAKAVKDSIVMSAPIIPISPTTSTAVPYIVDPRKIAEDEVAGIGKVGKKRGGFRPGARGGSIDPGGILRTLFAPVKLGYEALKAHGETFTPEGQIKKAFENIATQLPMVEGLKPKPGVLSSIQKALNTDLKDIGSSVMQGLKNPLTAINSMFSSINPSAIVQPLRSLGSWVKSAIPTITNPLVGMSNWLASKSKVSIVQPITTVIGVNKAIADVETDIASQWMKAQLAQRAKPGNVTNQKNPMLEKIAVDRIRRLDQVRGLISGNVELEKAFTAGQIALDKAGQLYWKETGWKVGGVKKLPRIGSINPTQFLMAPIRAISEGWKALTDMLVIREQFTPDIISRALTQPLKSVDLTPQKLIKGPVGGEKITSGLAGKELRGLRRTLVEDVGITPLQIPAMPVITPAMLLASYATMQGQLVKMTLMVPVDLVPRPMMGLTMKKLTSDLPRLALPPITPIVLPPILLGSTIESLTAVEAAVIGIKVTVLSVATDFASWSLSIWGTVRAIDSLIVRIAGMKMLTGSPVIKQITSVLPPFVTQPGIRMGGTLATIPTIVPPVSTFSKIMTGMQGVGQRLYNLLPSMTGFFGGIGTGATGAWSAVTNLGTSFRDLGKNIGLTGTAATIFKYSLAGIALMGAKLFADFDDSLTRVMAHLRDWKQESRPTLKAGVIDISSHSRTGATDLAKGLDVLVSSGMNAAMAVQHLGIAQAFAVAGNMHMQEATQRLVDIQRTLGMESSDVAENLANMTKLSDAFVGMAPIVGSSVDQLTQAFGSRFVTAAHSVNMAFQDMIILQGIYSRNNIRGSDASDRASRAIYELGRKSGENYWRWHMLGVDVFNANRQMKPMAEILEQLDRAFGGASHSQNMMRMALMGFESRTIHAILPLVGMREEMQKLEEEYKKLGGITSLTEQMLAKNFTGQMKQLWNQIVNMAREIGEILAPAIGLLAKGIESLIGWFMGLDRWIKVLVVGFSALMIIIKTGVIGALLGLIFNPFTIIIAGMAALLSLFMGKGFLDFITTAGPAIVGFFDNFAHNMKILIDWVEENWGSMWAGMGALMFASIQTALENVANLMQRWLTRINLFGIAELNAPESQERVRRMTSRFQEAIGRVIVEPGETRQDAMAKELNRVTALLMRPEGVSDRAFFPDRRWEGMLPDVSPAERQAITIGLRGGQAAGAIHSDFQSVNETIKRFFPNVKPITGLKFESPIEIPAEMAARWRNPLRHYHDEDIEGLLPGGAKQHPGFEFKQISLERFMLGGQVAEDLNYQQLITLRLIADRLGTMVAIANGVIPAINGLDRPNQQGFNWQGLDVGVVPVVGQ